MAKRLRNTSLTKKSKTSNSISVFDLDWNTTNVDKLTETQANELNQFFKGLSCNLFRNIHSSALDYDSDSYYTYYSIIDEPITTWIQTIIQNRYGDFNDINRSSNNSTIKNSQCLQALNNLRIYILDNHPNLANNTRLMNILVETESSLLSSIKKKEAEDSINRYIENKDKMTTKKWSEFFIFQLDMNIINQLNEFFKDSPCDLMQPVSLYRAATEFNVQLNHICEMADDDDDIELSLNYKKAIKELQTKYNYLNQPMWRILYVEIEDWLTDYCYYHCPDNLAKLYYYLEKTPQLQNTNLMLKLKNIINGISSEEINRIGRQLTLPGNSKLPNNITNEIGQYITGQSGKKINTTMAKIDNTFDNIYRNRNRNTNLQVLDTLTSSNAVARGSESVARGSESVARGSESVARNTSSQTRTTRSRARTAMDIDDGSDVKMGLGGRKSKKSRKSKKNKKSYKKN